MTDQWTLKLCALCAIHLEPRQSRGGTYEAVYQHPYNNCFLAGITVAACDRSRWNRRAPVDITAEMVERAVKIYSERCWNGGEAIEPDGMRAALAAALNQS